MIEGRVLRCMISYLVVLINVNAVAGKVNYSQCSAIYALKFSRGVKNGVEYWLMVFRS